MSFKVFMIAVCLSNFCNSALSSALAEETAQSCTLKTLSFNANSQVLVPASGSSIIWGGSATDGDESRLKGNKFFTDEWQKGQSKAFQNGLETFLYTEGRCGKTGGVNNGEQAKCKTKWASWDRLNPNRSVKEGPLWQQYTLAQFAAAKEHHVTFCEADNVEDESNLIPFLKAFERAFRRGDITCKLVLKNVRGHVIDSLGSKEIKSSFSDFSFLAPFAIFENDVGATVDLDKALRKLIRNANAITMISSDTHHYGRAFKPNQVVTCGGSTPISPIEPQGAAAAPSGGIFR